MVKPYLFLKPEEFSAPFRSAEYYIPFWYEQGIYVSKLLYADSQDFWQIFPYPKTWITI